MTTATLAIMAADSTEVLYQSLAIAAYTAAVAVVLVATLAATLAFLDRRPRP